MQLRKKFLKKSNLYLILDRSVNDYRELIEITKKAVAGGVSILQLRDKHGCAKDIIRFSEKLKPIVRDKALYIINDRVDLADIVEADGVHLGQDDLPVSYARKKLGRKTLIGQSCQSYAHAVRAVESGCDYIGFGSVFKTKTKPERQEMDLRLLRKIVNNIRIPVFAIGGIKLSNIDKLLDLGVERYAVCREICLSKNIRKTLQQFQDANGQKRN